MHSLDSCPVPTPARVDLTALGDFAASGLTGESLSLTAQNAKLEFPLGTLALEASAHADASDQAFIGFSERDADRLDFLLWPRGVSCDLFRGDTYPGRAGGEALGYAATTGLMMIAGSNEGASSSVVGALTFDSRTGQSTLVDPKQRAVLTEARAFATVSDFGGKILVAGGENPIHDATATAAVTAEVYDPATQRFEQDLVKLVEPTTRHGAATLETGETVLIGGRIDDADASNFIQIVSPDTRASKLLGTLAVARSAPSVLRLSDGRLFVAGGDDASGAPVAALEWRDLDASPLDAPFDGSASLPARYDRAFVPLSGGAVLAVGGCEDRPPNTDEDCTDWCERGCPPVTDAKTAQAYDAYWVSAEGEVTRLDFPLGAGRPSLLPGSDGQPWLIANAQDNAGQPVPRSRALYRFNPWHASFVPVPIDLDFGANASSPRFVSTGPDAFVWLAQDDVGPVLRGARLGVRSAFSNDVLPVTLPDPDDLTRPAHLVPDHAPGVSLSYDSGTLTFGAVSNGNAKPCAWVGDASYADFTANIDFSSPVAPSLRLGSQRFSDPSSSDTDGACQLPVSAGGSPSGGSIAVKRSGAHVSLTLGNARSECDAIAGHRAFAVCASELGSTVVSKVSITRSN